MQKLRVAQNSFSFGEVSDSLIMRSDAPIYKGSAQRLENLIVMPEGSVKKRTGLKHIHDYSVTYDSSYPEQSQLYNFHFDDNEQYVVSIMHQKIKVFLIDTAGTYVNANDLYLTATLTTDVDGNTLPFDKEYLQEYTAAQYGDVMIICHPLFAPRQLVRTSLTTFQVETFAFDTRGDENVVYQPYSTFHGTTVFLDPAATTGSSVSTQVYSKTGTADTDGIATSQSNSTSPFDFTLDGTLSSSGTATFTTGKEISFTSTSNNSADTFTITGTDHDGESITEDVTGPNNTTVYATKFFKTITGITSGSAFTGVSVGISNKESTTYFDITGSQSGGNYADSKHIGVTLRYSEAEMDIVSVQSSDRATVDISDKLKRRLSVLNPLRTIDTTDTVEVTMINHGFSGDESIIIEEASSVGNISASNLNGDRTVGDIIDDNTFTFTAGGSANTSEDGGGFVKIVTHAATSVWDEQSFSAVRGYPAAVTFHENRLVFAGTLSEPDKLFFSKIGSYYNFSTGNAEATDGFDLTAATGEVNQIRYLLSNRDLQVFTATGELYVPTYLNQSITPTNAQIRKQTPYGCEFVKPLSVDGATVFVQKDGKVVREYLYTDNEDAYSSTAISTIASHLIDAPKYATIVHSGFGLADSFYATTLSNGDLTLFTSNRAEKRAAWTRVTTDGTFGSVVAIHDRLFADVYYDNKLHLCEFDTDIGLDKWAGEVYTATSRGVFDSRCFLTNGSTTLRVQLEMTTSELTAITDEGLVVGDLIYGENFDVGFLDLSPLNGVFHEVTVIGADYIEFNYTMTTAATQTSTSLESDNGGFQQNRTVSGPYVSGNVVDVIYTEDSISKYESVTLSANYLDAGLLGTSGPDSNSTVYIGKKFTAKLETNPIDIGIGTGPTVGMPKGITNVIVDVKSTESMKVNSNVILDESFTGKKEVKILGYNRDPKITIEQDSPLPMQVNGLVAEVIV